MKDVWGIFESKGDAERSRWIRVGVAFDNRDGSINLLLDAVPLSGRLQIRERAEARANDDSTAEDVASARNGSA